MAVPVTESGEAHGGRHKCYSPGEGSCATQKKGKHTGHTHGEKLTQRDGHMKKKNPHQTQFYIIHCISSVNRTVVHFVLGRRITPNTQHTTE